MSGSSNRIHRWLTRQQVAEKLGCHINTIYKLKRRRDFPLPSTAAGHPRWREDEIDCYMESGKVSPDANPSQSHAV